MPTITATVLDIAGQPDLSGWKFSSPAARDSADGLSVISTDSVVVYPDPTGLLSIVLEQGAAQVEHDGVTYQFVVPATDSDLWDLIQAGTS